MEEEGRVHSLHWPMKVVFVGTEDAIELEKELQEEVDEYAGGEWKRIYNNDYKTYQLLQTMVSLIDHTLMCMRRKLCWFVIVQRDTYGKRLISMCVFRRIGDSQFHLNVTKSIRTWHDYREMNLMYPKGLALELHHLSLYVTGATWAIAPPLEHMESILKDAETRGTWHVEKMVNAHNKTDYSLHFTDEQVEQIKRIWPGDFISIPVYRFRPCQR